MKCPECGEELESGALFCWSCGCKIAGEPVARFCPECGYEVGPGAKFCENCGAKISESGAYRPANRLNEEDDFDDECEEDEELVEELEEEEEERREWKRAKKQETFSDKLKALRDIFFD